LVAISRFGSLRFAGFRVLGIVDAGYESANWRNYREEWQMVAPLLPELRPRLELRGRPLANTRAVLNGVLWVMYSGASWSTLPRKYPSYQTCHRRFKTWHESGVLLRVMTQLFGPAGESLYALMTSRMRVPPEFKLESAELPVVVQADEAHQRRAA
jgi:transposase